MYSSSSSCTSDVASPLSRRWKLWPIFPFSGGWPSRRLFGRLPPICRLPLLVLWTLIVIVLLYKSVLNDNNSNNNDNTDNDKNVQNEEEDREQMIFDQLDDRIKLGRLDRISLGQNQLLDGNRHYDYSHQLDASKPSIIHDNRIVEPPVITSTPPRKQPHNNAGPTISTTKKSTIEDYSKQSKVFILIVQNEYHQRGQIFKKAPYYRAGSSSIGNSRGGASSDNHNSHSTTKAFIPAHLRLLIEILNSHRIEYTVDTIQTGLPTSLLIDQDNPSEAKQYSVIVIDDFIRYTKLNRWVRDQLDRHCRSNQIGVVAYLTAVDELGSHHQQQQHSRGLRQTTRAGPSSSSSSSSSSLTTEESLANQFPLSFKPLEQHKSCNANNKPPRHQDCLIDYQLNERSPILRMLKRRQNFIVPGPLAANLNQSPWISMSSNHITYEPLTWARFRGAASHYDDMSHDENNTSETNHRLLRLGRRHAISLAPTDSGPATPEVASAKLQVSANEITTNSPASKNEDEGGSIERQILSMFDRGLYDGIKRVIFGGASSQWLDRMLILDAIEHLSSGRILRPLERYIQIDIDDIFVGERGTRLNASDVDALIELQDNFAKLIEGGFKFNLGYSGKYYKRGFEHENQGDERLIARAKEFTWFCHTWSHSKAHLFEDVNGIITELRRNLEFARQHKLPIIGSHNNSGAHSGNSSLSQGWDATPETATGPPTYAIAPHHSGVYPIHEQLYDAWRQVLNVQVTSTEEYPRLRPAHGRRAFVHKAIKVLPRQTCGLYTHTIYRHKYPGGMGKLDASIRGGELFETILHNPVNIYMSHMSNYANDRLAPYTFSALIEFVQTNTNLQLKYVPSSSPASSSSSDIDSKPQLGPAELANHYFGLFPEEEQPPLWTNFCLDKRHLAIWAPSKHHYCQLAPKLLIVGPQKTGTTALYTFLKMNPLFRSSQVMPSLDFEEIQFFNDKHYSKGVDWYFSRFVGPIDGEQSAETPRRSQPDHSSRGPLSSSSSSDYYYFDKSATYFDDPKVPQRASYLLPEARVIILLVDPADRAYSWYQHMRAHGDPAANSNSFEQIIMGNPMTTASSSSSSATATTSEQHSTIASSSSSSSGSSNDDDDGLPPAAPSSSSGARSLRNRCLHPGYYAQHLTKWLDYYPSRQIIIIDGQWFRFNPASVMNRLQLLLRVERPLDYGKLLVYDQQKGFYCQRMAGTSGTNSSHDHRGGSDFGEPTVAYDDMGADRSSSSSSSSGIKGGAIKCLGGGKGRKYGPMSREARLYLNRHYWPHNRQLARILSLIGQPLPIWLDEAMTSASAGHGVAAMYY